MDWGADEKRERYNIFSYRREREVSNHRDRETIRNLEGDEKKEKDTILSLC